MPILSKYNIDEYESASTISASLTKDEDDECNTLPAYFDDPSGLVQSLLEGSSLFTEVKYIRRWCKILKKQIDDFGSKMDSKTLEQTRETYEFFKNIYNSIDNPLPNCNYCYGKLKYIQVSRGRERFKASYYCK